MIQGVQAKHSHGLLAMWQDILGDLQDVFDVHFVCASFSYHVAKYLGSRALVAVADSESKSYDLWLTDPAGITTQHRWAREEAGLDPLLAYTGPAILDKLALPAAAIISGRLWLESHRQVVIAPLVPDDRPYQAFPPTLLALIDPPESPPFDLAIMGEIVDLMRVFLDRAALRQEVDRRTVEFAVITDISHALSSTLNVQQIYQLLTGPIRRTLNVETLSIGLIESLTGDIVFVDTLMGPMFERLPPVRLKRGQGIAGWVAEHQEPVIINNAYSDKRFFSGVDRRSGFRTDSMICIPLKVDERTIGVLQAINRQFGKFTDHDVQLMQGLSGPLAAAIENANLHADVLAEKRRIETLFASMSEGLVTVNRDGIITRANSAFTSLLIDASGAAEGCLLRDLVRTKKGSIDAVSYTHLDVYKRQTHHDRRGSPRGAVDASTYRAGRPRWGTTGSTVILTLCGERSAEDDDGLAGQVGDQPGEDSGEHHADQAQPDRDHGRSRQQQLAAGGRRGGIHGVVIGRPEHRTNDAQVDERRDHCAEHGGNAHPPEVGIHRCGDHAKLGEEAAGERHPRLGQDEHHQGHRQPRTGLGPVSYTHLDVYKRQGGKCVGRGR